MKLTSAGIKQRGSSLEEGRVPSEGPVVGLINDGRVDEGELAVVCLDADDSAGILCFFFLEREQDFLGGATSSIANSKLSILRSKLPLPMVNREVVRQSGHHCLIARVEVRPA